MDMVRASFEGVVGQLTCQNIELQVQVQMWRQRAEAAEAKLGGLNSPS